MPIVTTNSEHYQQIADTIRSYTGGEETFRPENMWGGIDGVYMAGYQAGQAEGDGGSYEEGYEQGKTDAIENLPDGYLKVDPAWTNFANLCNARPEIAVNLKYSDTSNGTQFLAMLSTITSAQTSEPIVVPRLDYRNAQSIQNLCIYSNAIAEIGEMEIPKVTTASNAFAGCTGLVRITFVPGCIKVAISFASSNLLDDVSIQSIVDGLADLTGQTAQTLTFHATVGAKLTEAQKATITAKNWTLVY